MLLCFVIVCVYMDRCDQETTLLSLSESCLVTYMPVATYVAAVAILHSLKTF